MKHQSCYCFIDNRRLINHIDFRFVVECEAMQYFKQNLKRVCERCEIIVAKGYKARNTIRAYILRLIMDKGKLPKLAQACSISGFWAKRKYYTPILIYKAIAYPVLSDTFFKKMYGKNNLVEMLYGNLYVQIR